MRPFDLVRDLSLAGMAVITVSASAMSFDDIEVKSASVFAGDFARKRDAPQDPVAILTSIMPKSASCASATYQDECATAAAAAQPMIAAFHRWGVNTGAEQAALISLMAYESDELQYNQNHYPAPGRPGQGTKAMMMPTFITKYVAALPELVESAKAAGSDPTATLKLVQGPQYTYGSAAWFYSTQCSEDVKKAVRSGSTAGWENYISACVGTDPTESGRETYWQAAMKALSVPVTA